MDMDTGMVTAMATVMVMATITATAIMAGISVGREAAMSGGRIRGIGDTTDARDALRAASQPRGRRRALRESFTKGFC